MDRKSLFFELINESLEKEGFKYLKNKNAFVKKDQGNEFFFGFDLWDHFYMVESRLDVLVEEVEKIKKNAWGKLYDKFVTLGRVKSYLIEKPSEGVVLTDTEENVRKAAKGEIEFYHSFAKFYYARALDYKYLDKKLNSNPGEELHIAHNPIHTSFLAIIVAKLTGNEKLPELFEFYRGIILKRNKSFIEEYELLVEYLKKI